MPYASGEEGRDGLFPGAEVAVGGAQRVSRLEGDPLGRDGRGVVHGEERGAGAVTAEGIAREAGVSLRTFYRYFRTKEEAVAPLLTGGVRQWLDDLAAAPPGLPVAEALESAASSPS
ncbi:TetR family transcriptional regulator, partial [Streptomyces daliensis]|nr:TetR family transcriptional regulator [Streptomyces daliensis]